jgi:hypothetical protein
MGCFNVACSVSNISIGCGDRVVYIPLLPANWSLRSHPEYKDHHVGRNSMLIYSNCYYEPFCLPIKGEYNDYGTLEYIDGDANTKALEKFFGADIEDILKAVTRGSWDGYTENDASAMKPIKNLKKLDHIDPKDLKALGFVATEKKDHYSHPKVKQIVFITKTKSNHNKKDYFHPAWQILNEKGEILSQERSSGYLYKLLEGLAAISGYYIGIPDEQQKKTLLLNSLSGMFIHEDIYNTLCRTGKRIYASPDERSLLKMGFLPEEEEREEYGRVMKTFYHPEVEDKGAYVSPGNYCFQTYDTQEPRGDYGVDTVEDLALSYVQKHGVLLDTKPFETECTYEQDYEKLVQAQKNYLNIKDKSREEIQKLLGDDYSGYFDAMRGPFNSHDSERKYFGKMNYAGDLYGPNLTKGLMPLYSDWKSAQGAFYSCNVFFFPAMNGEQHGNHTEHKVILEKALEIVNKNISGRDEE